MDKLVMMIYCCFIQMFENMYHKVRSTDHLME